MSLNIYLSDKINMQNNPIWPVSIIENKVIVKLSKSEWYDKFPNSEPIVVTPYREMGVYMYMCNIPDKWAVTAKKAGLYDCVWEPRKMGIYKASELIELLSKGLEMLEVGGHKKFTDFVQDYLAACVKYPDTEIEIREIRE